MSSATLDRPVLATASSAAASLLAVRALRKRYRSGDKLLEVLRGVDFDLAPGEFVSVIGQSGSGKSTLLHLMGLLDGADSGSVHLAGRRVDDLTGRERDRLRNTDIGMVFQAYHLLPELTALENVLAPLLVRHGVFAWWRERVEARRRATDLLTRFGLGERLHHKPRQLSGGEMQRVAIARALVGGPRLLLADEPTGNLDAESGAGILDVLAALNRSEGLSIVLVTHDASIARRADRIVRLVAGRVETA
jgi:lipoprotein-releasing system ATP-binding protein